jgi:talin
MISKVSSLLMTVKSVEDKTSRGARALDSSMDAIKQAVVVSLRLVMGFTIS